MRLYLHWPFCASRCSYCDFNSRVAGEDLKVLYREALVAEISAWSQWIGEEKINLASIYIGGGTPSLMAGEEVASLLGRVLEHFRRECDAEVTVEVNPADWSARDFEQAREGGVNRFSIGVQSLDDDMLALLGRRHNAREAKDALRSALDSGAAVSTDLLCALPRVGRLSACDSLDDILTSGPHHVSIYGLTLEERTPLAKRAKWGEVLLPTEDEAADEYLALVAMLRQRGYEQYEISNFSRPGCESRHNLAYWSREEYLGMGAGAHSCLAGQRFSNTPSILRYIMEIEAGRSAIETCEALDEAEGEREEIMLGLRKVCGIREELLSGRQDSIADFEAMGLVERQPGRIRLTTRGMLVSNVIIADLLPSTKEADTNMEDVRCA